MALEAVQAEPALAGRVLAFSGRHATLPEHAPHDTCVHLLHGLDDRVVPPGPAIEAARRLVALGGDVTADVLPDIGHELDPRAGRARDRSAAQLPAQARLARGVRRRAGGLARRVEPRTGRLRRGDQWCSTGRGGLPVLPGPAARSRCGRAAARRSRPPAGATGGSPGRTRSPCSRSWSNCDSVSMPSAITDLPSERAERDDGAHHLGLLRAAAHAAHERGVDLQAVDRQRGQVAQRRVAGAEVVDRQADAQVAQARQRVDARRRRGPSARSRSAPASAGCGCSRARDDGARHALREAAVRDVVARHVDLHASARRSAALRACHSLSWRQAVSSTKSVSGPISADSSAIGMNTAGLIGAVRRVLPARQRLEAGEPAGAEVEQRLVGHRQLAALDGAAQFAFERARGRSTCWCRPASNSAWRALPAALARYIAMSASRSTSSGSW